MSEDAKIFIGKNECESCAEEGKKPKLKWGMVIRMCGKTIFICKDCIEGIIDQIQIVKKKEEEGLIKVGQPPKT